MDQSMGVSPENQGANGLHSRAIPGATDRFTPRLSLLALCAYAKDFLAAVKSAQPLRGTYRPARLYLLCQALDLALTAYLVAHGVGATGDARETVNDLEALWSEAKSYGLDSLGHLTPTARAHLRKAAFYYSSRAMQRPALAETLARSSFPGRLSATAYSRVKLEILSYVTNAVAGPRQQHSNRAAPPAIAMNATLALKLSSSG